MQELQMACCEKPGNSGDKQRRPPWQYLAGGALGLALWVAIYSQLLPFATWFTGDLLGLDLKSHFGEAIRFFVYDGPKVLMLLTIVVFFIGVIRTWFTPTATRKYLAGKNETLGNVMASGLGVLTPFCSCSAVPLFVGFVTAGVPLGVTFSFLIAAPMVNEVALALLFGMFGFKVAALYAGLGLGVAIVAGWVLGRLKMENHLQDWVRNQLAVSSIEGPAPTLTWMDRIDAGLVSVKEIVGKVWVYMLVGIAAGAAIHGYVPEDFMASIMGKGAWWSVPAAVILGIPMYTNAAGIIPVIQALMAKGAALGTVLAFMMSVIALSLPEMIILKKVLKNTLIAVFIGVVGCGILLVGYVFNLVI